MKTLHHYFQLFLEFHIILKAQHQDHHSTITFRYELLLIQTCGHCHGRSWFVALRCPSRWKLQFTRWILWNLLFSYKNPQDSSHLKQHHPHAEVVEFHQDQLVVKCALIHQSL